MNCSSSIKRRSTPVVAVEVLVDASFAGRVLLDLVMEILHRSAGRRASAQPTLLIRMDATTQPRYTKVTQGCMDGLPLPRNWRCCVEGFGDIFTLLEQLLCRLQCRDSHPVGFLRVAFVKDETMVIVCCSLHHFSQDILNVSPFSFSSNTHTLKFQTLAAELF